MKDKKLLTILIFFIITRLMPYFGSFVPTGYDAGLYLYLLKHAPFIPTWLAGSYYSILFFVLTPITKLGSDLSVLLIPLQIGAALFIFFALNWAIKAMMSRDQRLFTLFIYTISAIQFRMYWFYYVKNMFALGFLLLFLGAFYRRRYLPAAIFGILVGLIHLPTFFILGAICAIEFIIHANKVKTALIFAISLCFTLIFYIPVFSVSILPYFKPFLEANRIVQPLANTDWGGTFYGLFPSILLMIAYLCLPIYYFFKNRKVFKEFVRTPYFSGLVATSIIVIGQFFFFKRFIPVWDIFIIIAAGYSVKQFLSMKYFYLILTSLFIVFFILKTGLPLKTTGDIAELQKTPIPQKSYVLSTSKEDTSWIIGYTNAEVIAWNFGSHSQLLSDTDWNRFYSTNTVDEYNVLLQKLPQPLYVYVSTKEAPQFQTLLKSKLLKKVSNQLYAVHK